MNSQQRREFFAEFLGEHNAKEVNTLLEKKLILKDQQKGLISWAKQVTGIKPEARRDLLARVDKMTEILTPENEDAFLEDLAAHKLGTTVTMEEAANIAELAAKTEEKRLVMEENQRRGINDKPTDTEMDYGRARVAFDNYIQALKEAAGKRTLSQFVLDTIKNPLGALWDFTKEAANAGRAIKSSFDNSFCGRQGRNLFFSGLTESAIKVGTLGKKGNFNKISRWSDTFIKSFKMIWDTFGGKAVLDEIKAEIISDPMYDLLRKARVATATTEEMYPTQLPEKIPVLGIFIKASDNAFTGSAHYMRYKVGKMYLYALQKSGADMSDKSVLESIGKLTNSFTWRGDTGSKSQKPGVINALLWSPRGLKADLDVLTAHRLDRNMSPFARKQAALNLLSIIAAQAVILGLADLIDDDWVTWDITNSDFGSIKIKNNRYRIVTYAPILVLAARLLRRKSTSSTTGKVTDLKEKGFAKRNSLDVVMQFLENKSSPAAGVVIDYLKNESDFNKPFTVTSAIRNMYSPMILESSISAIKDVDNTYADLIAVSLYDVIGGGASTYSQYGDYTKEEIIKKIGNSTKKDGSPKKGQEESVRAMKEQLRKLNQKD